MHRVQHPRTSRNIPVTQMDPTAWTEGGKTGAPVGKPDTPTIGEQVQNFIHTQKSTLGSEPLTCLLEESKS